MEKHANYGAPGMMTPDHTGQQYQSPMPMSQIQPDHQTYAQQGYAQPGYASPNPASTFVGQQPIGGESQYRNATPLASLQRSAAPVDCPACGTRALTTTTFKTGNTTHAWALGVCCLSCLGCFAYLVKGTKNIEHRCGKCSRHLATWHRSGTTEVHAHS
ncbi:LITAF-like zinc ribbon domain-containing protein [Phyllosticta capitalensis]